MDTPEVIAGLRERLKTEEDIQVKTEIKEALNEAEKSRSVVSDITGV